MSSKMQFLLVVYVCILQCQLFEFRALEGSVTHDHEIPHHHELRIARSAQPHTGLVSPVPSGNTKSKPSDIPVTPTSSIEPLKTNEPIKKSNIENATENTTTVNPTTDKDTITKQEMSQVKEELKEIRAVESTNVKDKENNTEDVTTSTPAEKLPKTQQSAKETEDNPVTNAPTNVLHKSYLENVPEVTTKNAKNDEVSSAVVASTEDSKAYQPTLANGTKSANAQKAASKDGNAKLKSIEPESDKLGKDKTPVESASIPKAVSS